MKRPDLYALIAYDAFKNEWMWLSTPVSKPEAIELKKDRCHSYLVKIMGFDSAFMTPSGMDPAAVKWWATVGFDTGRKSWQFGTKPYGLEYFVKQIKESQSNYDIVQAFVVDEKDD